MNGPRESCVRLHPLGPLSGPQSRQPPKQLIALISLVPSTELGGRRQQQREKRTWERLLLCLGPQPPKPTAWLCGGGVAGSLGLIKAVFLLGQGSTDEEQRERSQVSCPHPTLP